MEHSQDITSKANIQHVELPSDDNDSCLDSPSWSYQAGTGGVNLLTKPSLLVNPKLRRTFAYKGTTWKLDIIAGAVIILAAIIVIVAGSFWAIEQNTGYEEHFIIAGLILIILGLTFMCQAICWRCQNDGTQGENHYYPLHNQPGHESSINVCEASSV